MLKNLTNSELETYLRLCESNMEYLATKRRINPNDRQTNDDFTRTMSLRNKIYTEINTRLKNISNECTEENIQ